MPLGFDHDDLISEIERMGDIRAACKELGITYWRVTGQIQQFRARANAERLRGHDAIENWRERKEFYARIDEALAAFHARRAAETRALPVPAPRMGSRQIPDTARSRPGAVYPYRPARRSARVADDRKRQLATT